MEDISRKYGPRVKLFVGNRTILLLSDPSDAKTFLNHPQTLHKPKFIYDHFKEVLGNGLTTANGNQTRSCVFTTALNLTVAGEIWRQHRKLLNKTFNTARINEHVDTFQKGAEKLVSSLSSSTGSDIDLEPIIYKSLLASNTGMLRFPIGKILPPDIENSNFSSEKVQASHLVSSCIEFYKDF